MTDPRRAHTHSRYRRLRTAMLATDDTCWLCGRGGADTLDHVIPVSAAPQLASDPGNLRPAHESCNKSRGNGPPPIRQTTSRNW
jgi:5-methylcytosine-specific restriction endonuclease McrA